MTIHKISLHPSYWQLLYSYLREGITGGENRSAGYRIMFAIEEHAYPGDQWPRPDVPYSKAQREAIAEEFNHPLDPDARVTLELSPEQVDFITEQLPPLAKKAPLGNARALDEILDKMSASKEAARRAAKKNRAKE